MNYRILMDVAGDLDSSVAADGGVEYIPMEYSYMEQMRESFGTEDNAFLHLFYEGQRGGALTRTSQISPFTYREVFSRCFAAGESVLYLSLSSGLSATFDSACMTGRALEKDYPGCRLRALDTLSASGGMGVLAERAVRNKKAGMSLEENYIDLHDAASRIQLWLVVQDLSYLKRGGRLSTSSAVIGQVLHICPILRINEKGKLVSVTNKRGLKQALSSLRDYIDESLDKESGDVIYVTDADNESLGAMALQYLSQLYPNTTIRRKGISPIIGAHTGPDALIVCHMGKKK